jgi:hypothetical protein
VSDFSPVGQKGWFKGIRTVGDMAFLLGNPHILQNIEAADFCLYRRSSGQ